MMAAVRSTTAEKTICFAGISAPATSEIEETNADDFVPESTVY